ncbi:hypothetical protein OnM2_012017 [Erysiphe neolycopersici]|uniref:Uncharacterized protein n=1 Tax=Erysiphe neolycopersici TaxID=212602 RepID=A0A420I645_9PEZI|nr:hypothetical protein OnM2_012017 [Erysiphe neolycopersici]
MTIEPLPKVSSSQDEFTQFRGRTKLINEGPLDYMKILGRTKVEVSLTDLAQMSPAARKHWKHGMLRVKDKGSRKKDARQKFRKWLREINYHENQMIDLCNREYMTYKSFRVVAKAETIINGQNKYIVLDINYTHFDQGTDLNLIFHYLAKVLRLPSIKLPKPILFATAEGRVCRCVEALVLPPVTGNPCSLVLGLPWLFDVCGNLDITTFTLKIGDTSKGDKRANVQTTKFKLGQNNRLRLILADQRAMELAKAQICARDAESKRSEKHVQFLLETESKSIEFSHDNINYDYQNLNRLGNPLSYIHGVIPAIDIVSSSESKCNYTDATFPTNRRPKI